MWRSISRKYKAIIYPLIVCAILAAVWLWHTQDREVRGLLEVIDSLDYTNVETPVAEKIDSLLKETKQDPASAERWGKLGMTLYIHGFKPASAPLFKKAAALDTKDFRWAYFCALALNDLGSDETIDWLEKSRKLKPNYPPLCVMLGNLYLVSGELQKAQMLYNEVLGSYKNVPHAQVGLAKISIAENNLDAAFDHLNTALKIAPTYREPHVLLADVYRRKGAKDKVESELKIIEKLPDKLDLLDPVYNQMVDEGVSTFWHTVRGDNYSKSGQLDKAVTEFKKAIAIKAHASFYNNLGNVYQKQNKYDLAIAQYEAALQLDSVNIDALNNLGVVCFRKGDVNKAISFVKRSIKLNPDSKDGYLNLGTFYKHLDQRSQSVKYFRQGLDQDPDDLRFAYQLSWLFSSAPEKQIRNGKEALRLAKMIFESNQIDTPSKYDLVASALAENGQYDKARDMAQQAYQLAFKSGKHGQATEILKRQKLYAAHKPYRE